MYLDETSSRADLEVAIISDSALWDLYEAQGKADTDWTNEELLALIRDFIEAGDECSNC